MSAGLHPLGDVADFINGFAFKPDDWSDVGLPIIRIQNLTGTGGDFNFTERDVPDKYRVFSGDLLVSWSASLGVFQWEGPEALVNQHIFKVEPRLDRIDLGYLRHAIDASIHEMERFTHGSTMKHINRKEFLDHRIRLPPLPQQRRIAAILDKADALRRKRKRAIELLDSLTQSIFLEMFGDPTSRSLHPKMPLGEVVERIESGWSPVCLDRSASSEENGILKLSAITGARYDSSENKALPVEISPRTGIEVSPGDILLCRKNTRELVGTSAYIWETKPRLHMSDLIFRPVPKLDIVKPIFLQTQLGMPSIRAMISGMAGGVSGSMPNISKGNLAQLPVIVPGMNVQTAFAQTAERIHQMIGSALSTLCEAGALFSSLQSRAFAGQL